ncbi:hypothetical protein [Alkalihalobacillus sp. BA299]|uniref:hypothetical protein n=1 Tax=Alkalihalobacillus sp. BA299 TaxID=2815938 RepID=UPI001ADB8A30|nr:hypothetical protein [Alkalihalobacillus sp. BA299]
MNSSLATFLKVSITMIIISSLLIGIVYQALSNKNSQHEDVLRTEHQIQPK